MKLLDENYLYILPGGRHYISVMKRSRSESRVQGEQEVIVIPQDWIELHYIECRRLISRLELALKGVLF